MTPSLIQFVREQLHDLDNVYVGGYRSTLDGVPQVKVGIVVGDKKYGMIIADGDRPAITRAISEWKANLRELQEATQ